MRGLEEAKVVKAVLLQVKKEKGEKNVSDRDASFGKLEMHVVYCSDQAGSKAVILVDLGQIEYLKREVGQKEYHPHHLSLLHLFLPLFKPFLVCPHFLFFPGWKCLRQ